MGELVKKKEIVKACIGVEYLPDISEIKLEIINKVSFPWTEIKALGTSLQPLTSAIQFITTKGQAGSGLYYVSMPKGATLSSFKDKSRGSLGSYIDSEGNPHQANHYQLPCDPTMLCVAAMLASIEKKLDEIKEAQAEMMDFIVQKEKSEQRGDLNFLSDVLNNYKFNWNNDKYKAANHIKVLDIKQASERKVDFYREQIKTKLSKRSALHGDQEVKKVLSKIESDFAEYQLALYLFSFSSLLEAMLLENYDEGFLNGIKGKIENYSLLYRELYTECYNQIAEYSKSSIQSHLLSGLANVNTVVGKAIAQIPVISKSQLDESLIEAGERIEKAKDKRTEQAMNSLVEKQGSYVRPFIENLVTISTMYNQPMELYFDEENLYINQTMRKS